jgi:hypothetical protein
VRTTDISTGEKYLRKILEGVDAANPTPTAPAAPKNVFRLSLMGSSTKRRVPPEYAFRPMHELKRTRTKTMTFTPRPKPTIESIEIV